VRSRRGRVPTNRHHPHRIIDGHHRRCSGLIRSRRCQLELRPNRGASFREHPPSRQFGEQGAMATLDPLYPYAQAKQGQHQSALGAQRGYALCDRGSRPKIERSPKSCGRSVVKKRMPKTLRASILISHPAKCGKMARAA
jgi:hypothetical protein